MAFSSSGPLVHSHLPPLVMILFTQLKKSRFGHCQFLPIVHVTAYCPLPTITSTKDYHMRGKKENNVIAYAYS